MVPIHSARLHSCRGQHAGSWLSVFPVTFFSVARSRHYRLALRARVGLWLPGLASGTVACGGCGMPVDVCGMHYGSCKNRGNMLTIRHDLVESALISLLCYLRLRARSTRTAGNLFNDDRPPRVGPGGQARAAYRRADVYIDSFYGIAKHLFIDVAVPDPCSATSRTAGSAANSGVAAAAKEQYKNNKYVPLARRSDGHFYPAVIERFGAFGSQLVGLIKMLTGDGDRDPLADDDYVFATRSRTTYLVSHLCFTTVIADAYMMDAFMSHDVSGRPLAGASAAPPPPRVPAPTGTQRVSDPCFYEVAGVMRDT